MPAAAHARAAADSSTLRTPGAAEEDREDLFYGQLTVWNADDPEHADVTEPWGTATDVAAAVLMAIEAPEVGGFVIAMARGVPDDVAINPRASDPRDD